MASWVAVCCWILALLFGMFGLFCWVQDPFFEPGMNVDMGSIGSYVAGAGSVAMSVFLGIAGLIQTRRILLFLGLANLAVFVAVAVAMASDKFKAFPGWVLLAVSVLISVAMFVLWRACPKTPFSRGDFQKPADSERREGSS